MDADVSVRAHRTGEGVHFGCGAREKGTLLAFSGDPGDGFRDVAFPASPGALDCPAMDGGRRR